MKTVNKNCRKFEDVKPQQVDLQDDDNQNFDAETGEDNSEPKKEVKPNKFFINYIGGDLLSKEGVVRQFPFVLYLVLLAMIYITNTYVAEDMSREIAHTNKILEDRHVEYVYLKSEITQLTKQSVLVKKLKNKGIKESVEPLKKIVAGREGGDE